MRRILPKRVEIELFGGEYEGPREFTPMIPPQAIDSDLPFILARYQFPQRPCFAMSINKCHRQTLRRVGLYIAQSVFPHGDLGVAPSRSKKKEFARAIPPYTGGRPLTRNVVYRELLSN